MRSDKAKFTNEQVIEFRRRVRSGEISFTALGREAGVRHGTMRLLVIGRTYADVPGALSPSEIPKRGGNRRQFTQEQVLFMRLTYQGGVSANALARAYKINLKAMTEILKGRVYKEVPERVDLTNFMERVRTLSDEDVLKIRRYYASRTVSMRMLALEYGIAKKNIGDAIRGLTYKHLPLAVPAHIRFRNTNPLGNQRQRKRVMRASEPRYSA